MVSRNICSTEKKREHLESIYQQEKAPNVVICGDFNFDLLSHKTNPRKTSTLKEMGLTIHDSGTTCFRSKIRSRIDFILTLTNIMVKNKSTLRTMATDHAILKIQTTLKTEEGRNKKPGP